MSVLPEFGASPFIQNPWKRFVNFSGETIPPFSLMRIIDATNNHGEITFQVDIPTDAFQTDYLVNGPIAVEAAADGIGTTLSQAGYVAYNSGSGTPAHGEEWGAKAGQWSLEKYRPGFIIEGGLKLTAGVTVVVARQFPVVQVLGVNQEDLDQGDSCICALWFRKTDNSGWEESEYELLATYDWFMNTGETIEKGTKLEISLKGVWTVTGAYCSPSDDAAVIASLP